MGLFSRKPKTIGQIQEAARKKAENRQQEIIYRNAYNKGRREALAKEGLKAGRSSSAKRGGLFSGLGNALSSPGAQNIGRGANAFLLGGYGQAAPKKRKGHKGRRSSRDDYTLF